ncbi:hypothetical protein COCOBI_15-4200 [Coccomyxa sp. Obi]|nr:hypothetical protein COCOBI_15-4200 [Coccomyxa sp. Obi]
MPLKLLIVRGVAFACSAAYLVHPLRTLYVVFQTLESIGYGASITVLLLIMAMWLEVPKEPRPPHSKVLAIACRALLAPTAAMAVIISPLAFSRLYYTDSVAANDLGWSLQLAIFWSRAVVLALWTSMITYLAAFAIRSYLSDRKVRDSTGFSTMAPVIPVPIRSLAAIQKVDGRLLVNAILLSTLLETVPCAFQVTSLYYMYFNRDHWFMPLVVLPQYLELVLLNIPGLLPRLSQSAVAEPKSCDEED